MFRINPPQTRRLHAFLVLILALGAVACGGGENALPEPAGDPADELVFTLPQDGMTMSSPTTVSVAGDGITKVTFSLDGNPLLEDVESPFEWTLTPSSYAAGNHKLEVAAETADGSEIVSVNLTFQEIPSESEQPAEVIAAVQNLAAGNWYEIPNTKLRSVAPDPEPVGKTGLASVTIAWSGAAFDTKRNRLVVWGGGHGDYSGNEIYAFDLDLLGWKRLTDPSSFAGDPWTHNGPRHPDGRPVSRHTYDHIQYIPDPVDRFFSGGAGSAWLNGWPDDVTWLFDFETNEWEEKSTAAVYGVTSVSGVDSNGIVWQHANGLASYDAAQDKWTVHTGGDGVLSLHCTGVIDHANNRFLVIGNGDTIGYDLSATNISPQTLNTSGDTGIESGNAVGLAYHAASKRVVAWDGGSDVYTLDVNTLVWKRIQANGSVSPGRAVDQGTFGRFRYSAKSDLFVLYNRVDENTFVYRLPNP